MFCSEQLIRLQASLRAEKQVLFQIKYIDKYI